MRRARRLARKAVELEIGIWRSLVLWLLRRVPGRAPGVDEFTYAKELTPLLIVFTVLSAIEIPVVHLLLPWEPLRIVLLVVGVWGLLWMVGFLAGVRVFRHLHDASGLRVRNGTRVDLHVPWSAVADVTARRGRATTNAPLEVQETEGGTVAAVAVLKQTRVAITLREPLGVDLDGERRRVTRVELYADDPRAFVAAARARLAACTSQSVHAE